MKQLIINNPHYNYLEKSYIQWLGVTGYSESTINSFPLYIRSLFYYLESIEVKHITQATPLNIKRFLTHVQNRKNLRTGAGLSLSHINKHSVAINNFNTYLSLTGKYSLDINLRKIKGGYEEPSVLSVEEIKKLYNASYGEGRHNPQAIGQRDRAIIALLYGCGLRRAEASKLNLNDIDLIKAMVFVKKAKGNKQRYVPIAPKHLHDIREYLEEGRNWFLEYHPTAASKAAKTRQLKEADSEAFFLGQEGKRLKAFDYRLKILGQRAEIETPFSHHTLRHSIATHLLQSGMPLPEIAKFLGHATLDSTQIYTHIVNKINHEEPNGVI